MDSQEKSAIKSLVLYLRNTLEDELTIVLRKYGIFTDREWSSESPPDRLSDLEDREIWERVTTVIEQSIQDGRNLQESSSDFVRESAFTFLNRLVGLKSLEVRGIIEEVITTRDIYGGRSKIHREYREKHPQEARKSDDALPACLISEWQQVNDDMIGYLFDPEDVHSLIWPRYAVLKECISKINDLPENVWIEDEIIGWIYQFYNTEEKNSIRKRVSPKTPHEVAVRNQFYTPRYIVKYIVDNTLGRLWLEMHPDSDRVRQKCDFIVPESISGQDIRNKEKKIVLDQNSPINNPDAEPRRKSKPVSKIQLLDPACGTMHFGHYAMEVFDAMYRDARDWGLIDIKNNEIPGAILVNNLYGVDIDRRAVQLAALSLFLKARTMDSNANVKQVNLVSADAKLPDSDVRKKFLKKFDNLPKVQKAFSQVFDDMEKVTELGSLLMVEERLKKLLIEAGKVSSKKAKRKLDPRIQQGLPGLEPTARQMGLSEIAEDKESARLWIPQITIEELREDLKDFASQSLVEHDLNAQLFANEAQEAARLFNILIADYDIIVMNPPFGYAMQGTSDLLDDLYTDWCNNLLCAFYIRANALIKDQGFIGMVSDKTFAEKKTYEPFRFRYFLDQYSLISFLDLGWEVLDDANVEICTFITVKNREVHNPLFLDFRKKTKKGSVLESIDYLGDDNVYCPSINDLKELPFGSFGYSAPRSVLKAFKEYEKMDGNIGYFPSGGLDAPADEYYRLHWEVPKTEIGTNGHYAPFWNGVSNFSPYFAPKEDIILWHQDGSIVFSDPRSVV